MIDYLIRKAIGIFLRTNRINTGKINELKRLVYLIFGVVFISCLSILLLKLVEIYKAKKENREPKDILDLLNIRNNYSYEEIAVGMASSLIFGFIDNASLFFGLDVLKPYLPGGEYVKTGLANTFGDVFAFFLGNIVGKSIEIYTDVNKHPLWTKIFGTFLGCLLGVYIPALLLNKKIN